MQQDQRVARQIDGLERLSYDDLKERWRTYFGKEAPAYNKVFLVKRLAYRLQELATGGLPDSARETMRQILVANGYDERGCKSASGRAKRLDQDVPVLGTRLSREWNGRRHEVTVVSGGFEYEGNRYRSLTAVTRAITGTHWSGRAFFGLSSAGGRK